MRAAGKSISSYCRPAREQVHRARTVVFRLWAAGEGVPHPVFGLTSLLDHASAKLPDGIDATYATTEPAAVLVAAQVTLKLLKTAAHHVDPERNSPLQEFAARR